jgi:hypothetical protein
MAEGFPGVARFTAGASMRRTTVAAALLVACVVGLAVSASTALGAGSMRWNAVAIQAPANVSSTNSIGDLFGNMVCLTSSDCWSAGTGVDRSGANVPFVEHWDGTRFTLVRTPVGNAFLQGLACVSASDCWVAGGAGSNPAVGSTQLGHYSPVMEHWNGTRWAKAKVPDPQGQDNQLADVSCISSSSCYAVGWTSSPGGSEALIEHWTGKQWIVVSHTTLGGQAFAYLDGIDCVPHSVCDVVGEEQASVSSPPHAVGERGTGATWSIVTMPSPAAPNDSTELYGLSCPAVNDCLATGSAFSWPGGGLNPGEAIAERWNGRRWSLISPGLSGPASGGDVNRLSDIACVSTRSCWAVGSTFTDMPNAPAVTARWNGSAFTKGDNDNPYPDAQLDAVGCAGASECVAVGSGTTSDGKVHVIAEKLKETG